MATRLVEYVQFHNYTELRFEGDVSVEVGAWYEVVNNEHQYYNEVDFYEEDDEYNECEVNYDVITIYNRAKTDYDCMKLDGLQYTLIEFEVECDENNNLLWRVA